MDASLSLEMKSLATHRHIKSLISSLLTKQWTPLPFHLPNHHHQLNSNADLNESKVGSSSSSSSSSSMVGPRIEEVGVADVVKFCLKSISESSLDPALGHLLSLLLIYKK